MTLILTLLELFLRLKDQIVASRQATIRSSLNKLAQVLGYQSAEQAPVEAFNLPLKALYQKIDTYNAARPAAQRWGEHSVRNLKNDISYLLRLGRAEDAPLLPPPTTEGRLTRRKVSQEDLRRGEQYQAPEYCLREAAPNLEAEIRMYEQFCTAETSFIRPARLKRKAITMRNVIGVLLQYAGYLVKFAAMPAASLTLELLVTPTNVKLYLDWYIGQRQGKVTRSVYLFLGRIQALLKYLLLTEPKKKRQYQKYAEQLKNYQQNLSPAVPVHVKEDRMIPLNTLNQVGLSCYPEQAQQLKQLPREELLLYPGLESVLYGVMYSLIIRILVRVPMRQRNIREMKWNPAHPERGGNLYRRGRQWYVRYTGQEIKIERNPHERDGINRYEHPLPPELTEQLEEYLFIWYPILLARQTESNRGLEKIKNEDGSLTEQSLVFLTSAGNPLTGGKINWNFKRITYAFTGVVVNPHMVRTIWATEYIKRNRDIMGAAFRLGDKPETVMKHYAHLLYADVQERIEKFLHDVLSD